tara:strand:+ start:5 stop:922 length:918 start_codon:yes stop_codon:yes gene_type:complete
MRKERKINWQTSSNFNGKVYNFSYKRNYWGFRGEEFDPKNVQVIFEGGSTGNQRFTPQKLTIVGLINEKFRLSNANINIYNASTDGKSLNGYINDFNFWFSKIPNFNPKYVIFYIGINDREIVDPFLDYKISQTKIDQIKDYIKNNSIFVDKFKFFKNKYFPRNTSAYDFNISNLYDNFEYIDYNQAVILHKDLDNNDFEFLNKFKKKLNKLKSIIEINNFQPIFITQLKYDGLKDKKLFLVNNQLKKFSKNNKYLLIPLDEIVIMKKNDFYDETHTTPQGSERIANTIFPFLSNFFENKIGIIQ